MPIKKETQTTRQRQLKYRARIRSDSDRYEEFKRKDRERWIKRKESLKPKTNRKIQLQREKWREAKKRSLEKRRNFQLQQSIAVSRNDSIADVLPTTLAQSLLTSETITWLSTNYQSNACFV